MTGRSALIFAGLILLAWLPYAGSLSNDYVYDDRVFVVEQPPLREGSLLSLFSRDFLAPHRQSGLYRPITALSYALPIRLGADSATAQRAIQLVLHLIVGLQLYVLARRLGLARGGSFLVAALFLSHPVHTEAVALVSGRSELLQAAFLLAALLLLLPGEDRPPAGWIALLVALACGALAALSKETALVLPAVVLLLDLSGVTRLSWRPVAASARFVLFAGVALTIYIVGWRVVGSIPREGFQVENPAAALGLLERWPTSLAVIAGHAGLLLMPITLSADYSAHQFPVATSLTDPRAGTGLLVLGLLLVLFLTARGVGGKALRLGVALLVLPLVPVLQVLPIGTLFAERHAFLPSAGFCLIVGALLEPGPASARDRPAAPGSRVRNGLLALVLVLFAVRVGLRGEDLTDEETFYRTLVEDAPRSAKAHWLLANHLQSRGERSEALEQGRRALEIEPRFPEALYGMAYLHYLEGDLARAEGHALRCVEEAPGYAPAHALLGNVAFQRGRFREAADRYRRALRLDPELPGIDENLQRALRRTRE